MRGGGEGRVIPGGHDVDFKIPTEVKVTCRQEFTARRQQRDAAHRNEAAAALAGAEKHARAAHRPQLARLVVGHAADRAGVAASLQGCLMLICGALASALASYLPLDENIRIASFFLFLMVVSLSAILRLTFLLSSVSRKA